MDEVIKWGIIGLGNIAHEFAKSFYNTKTDVSESHENISYKRQKFRKFREDKNVRWIMRYIKYFERSVKNDEIPKTIPKHRQAYLTDKQIKLIHYKVQKMIQESLID